MIPGIRGRLVTETFAREELASLPGAEPMPHTVRRAIHAWSQRCDAALGPASSVRALADVALIPLLRLLGYEVSARKDSANASSLRVTAGRTALSVHVAPWGEPLSHAWRAAIVQAIDGDAAWSGCCNGLAFRIVDARNTWSREHLEFDLAALAHSPEAQDVLWTTARAAAMDASPPLLDRAVHLSRRHGIEVCRTLGAGVLEALGLLVASLSARTRHPAAAVFEQSLTVLYRVLFLLFAESRGALPLWHPVYRDSYSMEAIVSTILAGGTCRGLWQALRAISRLAHAGCAAGELRVTAFNGRLFSPVHAAAFDATPVPDAVMQEAVVAVATTPRTRRSSPRRHPAGGTGVLRRIAYRDLDVEQLGAVYEQVLEYEAVADGRSAALTRTSDARKATGSFYTPRPLTSYLVRRTLEPLVRGRAADGILAIRVLDPAMGSGAFLVAACRFLAAAAEAALIRHGTWHAGSITPGDRAGLRREIASRCLFGVDLNPMAVQLARLSIWLATLAADRPLSFLDHHLVAGDSLVGATPDDVARGRLAGTRRRSEALPLFDNDGVTSALHDAVRVRLRLESDPDDSASVVRAKERLLSSLHGRDSSLARWGRVLDLWCSAWFWEDGAPPEDRTFGELAAHILRERSSLPDHIAAGLLDQGARIAAARRFLHWPIVFPEVFVDGAGRPLVKPGFDAVLGNPPWDMVRGDSGDEATRGDRRVEARGTTRFARASGIYRVDTRAHLNRYQLFLERALQLARAGGRIGFVLPSGITGDTGVAALRRRLFTAASVDEVTGIDNRAGIFPIHRGLRFVLLTATSGEPTTQVRCRFGMTRAEELEREDTPPPVVLTRAFLARVSGEDDLGIPELGGGHDLRIVERVSATCPRLADAEGWRVRFGRELNASDDRGAFVPYAADAGARPIVEGKNIEPFRVSLDRCRWQLATGAAAARAVPRRARLCYRDIASATNRLTLIAAVLPARAVSIHTLFCLKTPLPLDAQHVLCALLNSFVANYLIRLRVNTHVTASLMAKLPVPRPAAADAAFARLARLTRALTRSSARVDEMPEYAELQALAARLYALSAAEFEHVLGTFPLVPGAARDAAMRAFVERP
jgi:hypothetical protein